MVDLELECSHCHDKITLDLPPKEYDFYLRTRSLIEGSEAYHEMFDGFGWVLQQAPFCDNCKYDHSEVYQE